MRLYRGLSLVLTSLLSFASVPVPPSPSPGASYLLQLKRRMCSLALAGAPGCTCLLRRSPAVLPPLQLKAAPAPAPSPLTAPPPPQGSPPARQVCYCWCMLLELLAVQPRMTTPSLLPQACMSSGLLQLAHGFGSALHQNLPARCCQQCLALMPLSPTWLRSLRQSTAEFVRRLEVRPHQPSPVWQRRRLALRRSTCAQRNPAHAGKQLSSGCSRCVSPRHAAVPRIWGCTAQTAAQVLPGTGPTWLRMIEQQCTTAECVCQLEAMEQHNESLCSGTGTRWAVSAEAGSQAQPGGVSHMPLHSCELRRVSRGVPLSGSSWVCGCSQLVSRCVRDAAVPRLGACCKMLQGPLPS